MNPKMHIVKKCILYIFLITIAVVWFIPIFTLLATALKNKSDFFSLRGAILPMQSHKDGYLITWRMIFLFVA